MREIKFRVWNKEECKMYNSKELIISFNQVNSELNIKTYDGKEIYDYKLMQYIGTKDTFDDKEIYEGDIIKRTDITPTEGIYGKEEIGIVEYLNSQFILRTDKDRYYEISSDGVFYFYISDYEVIGNIYENPELLGE